MVDERAESTSGCAQDMERDTENVVPIVRKPSHIVGVGASAGGLEAIEAFFDHMPASTGLAFVVVQHLAPDYKSLMKELLSKHTEMTVLRIEDGMEVEPDHVYLIPPKKNLKIFHNKLLLTEQEAIRGINLPIDVFLRSLADDQGERTIAVILSGTGSDGTRGLRAIKEAGGIAMVQTEESAKFNGMPRAALASGLVDFVLPPEEMPQQILACVKHPYASKSRRHEALLDDQDGLTRIFALLRERSKVDFTYYKPSTVIRRIERRMTVNEVADLRDYVETLERYPGEIGLLFRELLIGVTSFFRDPDAFATLERVHLPALFKDKENHELRFWVAGCSTGEEAYTFAMVARQCMERIGTQLDLKIFATDVDRDAILVAGAGEYPESVAADLPDGYLSKYFHRRDDRLVIARTIREMVVFAQHDLIRDPPFTHIDLVSCRNLLIYLQPVLQNKVLELFNFSLVADGLLVLGPSETTGELADYFEPLNHKYKIYQSRGRSRPLTDTPARVGRRAVVRPRFGTGAEIVRASKEERALDRFLQVLSPELVQLAILVNSRKEVVHIIGDSSEFFSLPTGSMSADITKMAIKDLRIALATGLQKVLDSEEPLTYTNVRLHDRNPQQSVTLRLRPLPVRTGQEPMVAVLIDTLRDEKPTPAADQTYDATREAEERILDLEQELQFNRESLQATIEELETANEELQATNEELLASNEELQSTNEELQSVNEELHTVNAEYHSKIVELTELNNDMENLLASTQIGTLFVDENLEVRKLTPGIRSIILVNDGDIGRPVEHLRHRLEGVELAAVIHQVQDTNRAQELTVTDADHRHFLLRCLPYEIGPDTFSGVVLTFIDVTEQVHSAEALQHSEDFLSKASAVAKVGAWSYSVETGRQKWSEEVFHILELEPGEAPDADRGIAFYDDEYQQEIRTAFTRLLSDGTPYDLVARVVTAKGNRRWVRAIGEAVRSGDAIVGALGAFQDITAVRAKEKALLESEHRYQQLFQAMADGFALHRVITDADGTAVDYEFLEVNPAFEKLTGLKRPNVLGRRATEVIPGLRESEAKWVERYGRVAATGEPESFEAHEPALHRWFRVLAYCNQPGHFVTLFSDVSEEKARELELAATQRMLDMQRRLAEAFLTTSASELLATLLEVLLDASSSPIGFMGFVNAAGDMVSPSLTRHVWDRCMISDKSIVFPRDSWRGLWGRSLLEKRTLWDNNGLHPPEGHVPLKCALVVPILLEGRLIGQLAVANKEGGYGEHDARTLEEMAAYLAPFLQQRLDAGLEKEIEP